MALSEAQVQSALRQMEGAKPRFRKGKCGKQYDAHTCSNCGVTLSVVYRYCPGCGFRLLWDNPACLTGNDEEE